MTTSEKGNEFEEIVYKHFLQELQKDALFVSTKNSHLFKKKSYYSRDRKSNIIVDISIETFLPTAKEYSLLTVIECKDYSRNVPVDDIEEFHAKVQQISGNNIKAIFTTTSALQKAAFSFAASKKIAVIRFLPSDQIRHIHYWMPLEELDAYFERTSLESELYQAFFNQKFINETGRELYVYHDEKKYDSLFNFLEKFFDDH